MFLFFSLCVLLAYDIDMCPQHILQKSSCLHYLLSDKWDYVITDRLRHPKTFKPMLMKTEKFCNSFVPYYLKHYD